MLLITEIKKIIFNKRSLTIVFVWIKYLIVFTFQSYTFSFDSFYYLPSVRKLSVYNSIVFTISLETFRSNDYSIIYIDYDYYSITKTIGSCSSHQFTCLLIRYVKFPYVTVIVRFPLLVMTRLRVYFINI